MKIKVKLRNAINKAYAAKQELDKAEAQKKQLYQEVMNLMDEDELKKCEFENQLQDLGFEKSTATLVENTRTVWDAQRIKDVCPQVIEKSVEVKDAISLVQFLKKQGIKFADVKEFFDIKDVIDMAKLEQALALGEVSQGQVSKAMSVSVTSRYVKITKKSK